MIQQARFIIFLCYDFYNIISYNQKKISFFHFPSAKHFLWILFSSQCNEIIIFQRSFGINSHLTKALFHNSQYQLLNSIYSFLVFFCVSRMCPGIDRENQMTNNTLQRIHNLLSCTWIRNIFVLVLMLFLLFFFVRHMKYTWCS